MDGIPVFVPIKPVQRRDTAAEKKYKIKVKKRWAHVRAAVSLDITQNAWILGLFSLWRPCKMHGF